MAGAPASFAWLEPLLVFHGGRGAVTRPCTHLGYTEVIATGEATLKFEAGASELESRSGRRRSRDSALKFART